MVAAYKGDIEVVNMLLEHASKFDINQKDKQGKTALFYALESPAENSDVISTLLDREAEVNVRIKDGVTPLLKAVDLGYHNIAELLLQQQANVNDAHQRTGTS